jgi:hypothetical protein
VTPKFTFDYIYRSGDEILNDIRYAKVDIAPLKQLFVMSKSHCSSQLNSWNLYDESGSKLLLSNANTTIQNSGDDLLFSTENFGKN